MSFDLLDNTEVNIHDSSVLGFSANTVETLALRASSALDTAMNKVVSLQSSGGDIQYNFGARALEISELLSSRIDEASNILATLEFVDRAQTYEISCILASKIDQASSIFASLNLVRNERKFLRTYESLAPAFIQEPATNFFVSDIGSSFDSLASGIGATETFDYDYNGDQLVSGFQDSLDLLTTNPTVFGTDNFSSIQSLVSEISTTGLFHTDNSIVEMMASFGNSLEPLAIHSPVVGLHDHNSIQALVSEIGAIGGFHNDNSIVEMMAGFGNSFEPLAIHVPTFETNLSNLVRPIISNIRSATAVQNNNLAYPDVIYPVRHTQRQTYRRSTKTNISNDFMSLEEMITKKFNVVLKILLDRNGKKQSDVKKFLADKEYPVGDSSVDRYFNGSRSQFINVQFVELFAEFLCLSEDNTKTLLHFHELWINYLRHKFK